MLKLYHFLWLQGFDKKNSPLDYGTILIIVINNKLKNNMDITILIINYSPQKAKFYRKCIFLLMRYIDPPNHAFS